MTDSTAHPVPGGGRSISATTRTGGESDAADGPLEGRPFENQPLDEGMPRHGDDHHGDDHHGDDHHGGDTSAPSDVTDEGERTRRGSFWKELPFLILTALVIAVLIKTFAFQAFYIPSSSMEDTLEINDRVLVNKIEYRIGEIERGDVIVFDDPNGDPDRESIIEAFFRNLAESVGLSTPKSEFIKRVIALPGEEVRVDDGVVFVDGVPLEEPYVHPSASMPEYGPVTVEPGRLFVMGDNRNSSQDSRFFGTIDADSVVGRAFVILWPPSRWAGL